MDVQLHRLLLLLFLLSWPFFHRDSSRRTPLHHDAVDLHPIVLLPGHSCSQLRACLADDYEPAASPSCGARKGTGWFRLWENDTALQDPALVPCYEEQLRVVYDPVARDYRDAKGVDVRVVSFGTTRSFGPDNPAQKNGCMKGLVAALEGVGYKEGENLFGAPYDFRYAPAPPGQPGLQFSDFVSSLRLLIERASERNGNKPVILVTHNHGGINAAAFLNENTVQWRRRHVKHFVMVSMGAGGGVPMLKGIVSTTGGNSPPTPADVLSLAGNTARTFGSALIALPTPKVFGHAPLVITRAKNYSAYDMPELLAAVGFDSDDVARYRTRVLPVTMDLFRAMVVPMTCINAVGVQTVEKLVYGDGDLGAEADYVYGDGDGSINLASMLALDMVIGGDPDQEHYKSVFIPNTTHSGIIMDGFALERVVTEILEANNASY